MLVCGAEVLQFLTVETQYLETVDLALCLQSVAQNDQLQLSANIDVCSSSVARTDKRSESVPFVTSQAFFRT